MTKRISCRVVKSVPLSRVGRTFRPAAGSDDRRRPVDAGLTANVPTTGPARALTYTNRSGRAKISSDNAGIGRILDCYA
jgi:hypothetical protein